MCSLCVVIIIIANSVFLSWLPTSHLCLSLKLIGFVGLLLLLFFSFSCFPIQWDGSILWLLFIACCAPKNIANLSLSLSFSFIFVMHLDRLAKTTSTGNDRKKITKKGLFSLLLACFVFYDDQNRMKLQRLEERSLDCWGFWCKNMNECTDGPSEYISCFGVPKRITTKPRLEFKYQFGSMKYFFKSISVLKSINTKKSWFRV